MGELRNRDTSAAAIHPRRVGDIEVTVLSDGYLDATLAAVRNPPPDADDLIRRQGGRVPPRINVNTFLVKSAGRFALIDTGSGDSMGPTLGQLPRALAAAGVAPEAIDTVLLTHMHPDHSNGLSDAAGRRLFPNAEVVLHENEIPHWFDDAAMARAIESQRIRYFGQARHQIAPYRRDRVREFRGGEVFPGVTAIPIPGHTPGHTAYLIASGRERLLVWGDTVHIPELQVPRPETTMMFDTDPAAAAASRVRVFDMVAAENLPVAGMHLHFPGFARMTKSAGNFQLIPES
ncbi:MAG: MBL fold metallo-hydrolase [Hyphomicrobiales bacterium]|nr:MBL fold metallo-hydrolase [Hyphomicrobiales bacterium]MBV9429802.1 MBL fold metallo-hydrolase [Bradyrhizobiaceae bacterium]